MIARAVLALLLGCAPAAAAPARVMSINVCTDSLLLDLLPALRITSVSWLARNPELSVNWRLALGVSVNHGTAEEVLTQHPDLVLAGQYTTPGTRALLQRLGVPVLVVPPATSWAQIRAVTMSVAAAVGVPARGMALIAGMDGTLAALASNRMRPSPRVLAWDGAGNTEGPGTLFDTVLTAAGGISVGAGRSRDLEQVVASQPDILAHADGDTASPGLRAMAFSEPVLQAIYHGRIISYAGALDGCGVPETADMAVVLRGLLAPSTTQPIGSIKRRDWPLSGRSPQ